jgi:hypothetical protein
VGIADEVLAQLDQAAADFMFPDLNHGYYYAVDARMSAFGDGFRWALAIETVGYTPGGGNLIDVVHSFGNCLTTGAPGYENADFYSRVDNMDEVRSRDDPERYLGAAPLVVRGHVVAIDAPKGEELWSVFRRLVPEYRDLLFGDDAEVRRRLPADLPALLQLEQWNQPDPLEMPPSHSEVYQLVAAVLESHDPSRYCPTLKPNTHWSNWPESGSL